MTSSAPPASSPAELRPIAEGLFTWPSDSPQLIGSRCTACGNTSFPAQASCPRCTGTDVEEHLLPRDGTLWTWTIQGFRPKSPPYTGPADFEPYPVGYVELAGELKVESLLIDVRPEALVIGMPMELAIVPFTPETGEPVLTFAFRPPAAPGSEATREEPTSE